MIGEGLYRRKASSPSLIYDFLHPNDVINFPGEVFGGGVFSLPFLCTVTMICHRIVWIMTLFPDDCFAPNSLRDYFEEDAVC